MHRTDRFVLTKIQLILHSTDSTHKVKLTCNGDCYWPVKTVVFCCGPGETFRENNPNDVIRVTTSRYLVVFLFTSGAIEQCYYEGVQFCDARAVCWFHAISCQSTVIGIAAVCKKRQWGRRLLLSKNRFKQCRIQVLKKSALHMFHKKWNAFKLFKISIYNF